MKWKNTEEYQYINTMIDILNDGIETNDRTEVGTLSLFGKHFTYDLSDTFPALTTKRIFMRGIFEELMMYLTGKTDNGILNDKNIHIWDGNTTREFLDKRGLSNYPVVIWGKHMDLTLDILVQNMLTVNKIILVWELTNLKMYYI